MKKLTTTASPFTLLLVPVLLLMGFLFLNTEKEIPVNKQEVSISFQLPSFKNIIAIWQ